MATTCDRRSNIKNDRSNGKVRVFRALYFHAHGALAAANGGLSIVSLVPHINGTLSAARHNILFGTMAQ